MMTDHKLPHIVFIQSNPVLGSAESYLTTVIHGVCEEARYRCSLVYPDSQVLIDYFAQLPDCVSLYPLRYSFFESALPHRVWQASRFLRKLSPDLLHFNEPGLAMMAASEFAGCSSRIVTFHTPSQTLSYNRSSEFLNRLMLRRMNAVIALAPSAAITVHDRFGVNKRKIHVIETGLDSRCFSEGASKEGLRSEWGVAGDACVLCCVARLESQKNHALLIKAYARLGEDLKKKSHLMFIGSGSLREELTALAEREAIQEHVSFLGHRDNVAKLLHGIDVFVLGSFYEGLPFALLEAMAIGRPAIVTDTDGMRDAVVDGKTGFVLPQDRADLMASSFAALINDPERRSDMGIAARERFAEKHTADRMVAETKKLYQLLYP